MQTQETSENQTPNQLTDPMRALLAAFLIAGDPLNIETAAVRAGISLSSAQEASQDLLKLGLVDRAYVNRRVLYQATDHPEVLSQVASAVCEAYSRISQRHKH